ncbi:MAG: type II toxin-antitoxin system HicA family toxin [Burkholderiaceae bacterium]|jgi:predicted RNA binding protein YcfA (HicA-like mRNA interferase family)|nr:type II toxin-antitoxin system HicA family toxin [Burkholderiaceae bacterium]
MNKKDKLLAKINRNPGSLKFDEFRLFLKHQGWKPDRQEGSHEIWVSPGGHVLPIQPRKGKDAKDYQVRQALKIIEQENKD